MVSYFPQIYDDELLYSAISRYRSETGRSVKATLSDLFGCNNVIVSIDFQSHLDAFCRQFGDLVNLNPNELFAKNTMAPLYLPFLDSSRQEYLLKQMCSDDGKGIFMKIGAMASSISTEKFLKYCPLCINEDVISGRYPYWRRSHNVDGVTVCYKHGVLLRTHCPLCGTPIGVRQKNNLVPLSCLCLQGHDLTIYCEENRPVHQTFHQSLAQCINTVLNTYYKNISISDIDNKYNILLENRGFVTHKGNIRRTQLKEEFLLFYPVEFLKSLNLDFNSCDEYTWIEEMLRKRLAARHPVKHILLLNFLHGSSDIKNHLLLVDKAPLPFGNPPWPCLNPVADHYMQNIISDCKVTYNWHTKSPVGTFICNCGFVYTRKGPDTDNSQCTVISRVKNYGHVWKDSLRNALMEGKIKIRELSEMYHADEKTIRKHALPAVIVKTKPIINGRDSRTQNYIEVIKNYIGTEKPTKSQVRKKYGKEYMYLYRHNKRALCAVLKCCQKASNHDSIWPRRDDTFSNEIFSVIEKMKFENCYKRITLNLLGRKILNLRLIQNNLNMLPKTVRIISEYCETIEQYQIRRAARAVEELKKSGVDAVEWKIYKKANIKHTCSPSVKSEIHKLSINSSIYWS